MREVFGYMPDGRAVEAVSLRAGRASARVIAFGAALQSLCLPDRDGEVDDIVLGHDDLQGYLDHRGFFGATVGRVANRIAGGRFTLDGREVVLPRNEPGATLHGGPEGFDRRLWQIGASDAQSAELSLISPDGDQGFPGRLAVRVRYRLEDRPEGPCLEIVHEATTDAPTPVALTHHSFFALAGARALAGRPRSALGYDLTVPAARYLPVDDCLIPMAPASVQSTPFDFRTGRRPVTALRAHAIAGYDHTLCLDGGPVRLADPISGRVMMLETDQPGLQVYTGNFLDGSVRGKGGRAYAAHDAICLEPQSWPNAVNMPPGWGGGDIVLRPGMVYRNRMAFAFAVSR